MSQSIAVVCEGPADLRTVSRVTDCVIRNAVAWMDDDLLPLQRTYRGFRSADDYLKWDQVRTTARREGVSALGFSNNASRARPTPTSPGWRCCSSSGRPKSRMPS